MFSAVITTPEIANECGDILPEWVIIKEVVDILLKNNFSQYVDVGEASAIALAAEIKSDYIILDDLAARKFAEKL